MTAWAASPAPVPSPGLAPAARPAAVPVAPRAAPHAPPAAPSRTAPPSPRTSRLPPIVRPVPKWGALTFPSDKGIEGKNWGVTASVQFPHPLMFEANWLMSSAFTFAGGLGGLKVPITGSDGSSITLGITAIEARGRWHPWDGGFFLGTSFGYQSIYGTATEPITFNAGSGGNQTIKTTVKASINSTYLTPQLGWFWVFEKGFCVGFDLGLQVPVGAKTVIDISTDNQIANDALDYLKATKEYKQLESQVADAGNRVGKIILPYFTFFRIGWMF